MEKPGHAREETQRRPGIPCVDRGARGAQGIRSDPEAIRDAFNLSAERGHTCDRRSGILREERPTDPAGAV